jgi:hypothetical protein
MSGARQVPLSEEALVAKVILSLMDRTTPFEAARHRADLMAEVWPAVLRGCAITGCTKPYQSNGMCGLHLQRHRRAVRLEAWTVKAVAS